MNEPRVLDPRVQTHDEAFEIATANVADRFPKPGKPTDEQQHDMNAIADLVAAMAFSIEWHVPAGRQKELALTALEEISMRANRGIMLEGASKYN